MGSSEWGEQVLIQRPKALLEKKKQNQSPFKQV